MIKVKICGITNVEDARIASGCGADAVGFIFSKKSPRYVTEQLAKKIIQQLDPFLIKVGVFLDEKRRTVFDMAERLGLDALQFHGHEAPSYCHFFRPRFKVIKVFFPEDRPFKDSLLPFRVDAYMFDIRYEDKLGGKKSLSADLLSEIKYFVKEGHNIIISGGLNPRNVSRIKRLRPYAVDVASGVERLIGRKDENLIKQFIERVKDAAT